MSHTTVWATEFKYLLYLASAIKSVLSSLLSRYVLVVRCAKPIKYLPHLDRRVRSTQSSGILMKQYPKFTRTLSSRLSPQTPLSQSRMVLDVVSSLRANGRSDAQVGVWTEWIRPPDHDGSDHEDSTFQPFADLAERIRKSNKTTEKEPAIILSIILCTPCGFDHEKAPLLWPSHQYCETLRRPCYWVYHRGHNDVCMVLLAFRRICFRVQLARGEVTFILYIYRPTTRLNIYERSFITG